MYRVVNLLCYILGEVAVNKYFYSRFKTCHLDIYLHGSNSSFENYWWYQQHSTSYWFEKLNLSLSVSIKSTQEFEFTE